MADSERSYATDEDVEQIVGATQRRYQQRLRLRRLLNGMMERELGVELESFTLEALQGEIEKRMLAGDPENWEVRKVSCDGRHTEQPAGDAVLRDWCCRSRLPPNA
ncbi:hypothetical protein LCGC14_1553610 [marine sediment metagenome]|uniref:Uncharacterized protein n=1 Tax=marine sediment metagenome TaxID=412755 RepID=A0A0F9JAM8_9ZZZZ